MGIVRGKVTDAETGAPVPGATVSLATGDYTSLGVAVAADGQGNYTINNPKVSAGVRVVATSVGYNFYGSMLYSSDSTINFQLIRDIIELDPVIVGPKKPVNKAVMIGGAALLLLLATKNKAKRKISGILPGGPLMENLFPVVLIGGMYIVIKYGPDILEKLGLKKDKDEKATEDAISDPNSYWDASFWKKGGTGTFILTGQRTADFLALLEWSFGAFNDDEDDVINAFKTLKTQSQLSYLADQFQQKKGKRLADWLFAESWPNDRLSLSEMADINKYIEKLPKYKP